VDDVTGLSGAAFYKGVPAGAFELRGGRRIGQSGRPTEHVEIQFFDSLPSEMRDALEIVVKRDQRLPEPLTVDLELESGQRLSACEVAAFWGGHLGERWFGISLDLDLIE
jgi:predicted Zn-dependent protease with MMP-like domain